MTWTFNSTNVGSSGLATVRFLIGDVSSGDQLVQDETITAVLTNVTSNNYLAGALVCDQLSGYYSRQADTRNEGLDVNASQRAKAFRTQAAQLRRQAYTGATMFIGGRSMQTKEDRRAETDLVQPAFETGMHDYLGTVSSSTE